MPYDIPVYFSIDDINGLKEAGVQVMAKDPDTLVYVCNKIGEIVESLNIPEDATDKEKLDAIMIYILSNYSYDPEFVKKAVSRPSSYLYVCTDNYTDHPLF